MAKLDQTYIYFDMRKMKTHYAQISFTELEIAYTKLTSGSSMRLYLYLLHKISGRTPYDRNNKPRLGYHLGIQQIESAIGISRASIYRGFAELVKHGLVQKHTLIHDKDNKNIICTLAIPLKIETKTTQNEPQDTLTRSQYCDGEILEISSLKGNSSQKQDLNIEPINLKQPKTINYPLTPKGKKNKTELLTLEKAFKNDQRKKEIYRIVHALENHGYNFIDEVMQFSNIYSWLRKDTNLSRRKRDLYQAIEIHNDRIKVQHQLVNLQPIQTVKRGNFKGGGAPEKIKKDEDNLIDLLDGAYNSSLHDNLIHQDSFFWHLPSPLQDKYLPIITKKIQDGKALKHKQYEEKKKLQADWDKKHLPTQTKVTVVDTTSPKYKQLKCNLIDKFTMYSDKK